MNRRFARRITAGLIAGGVLLLMAAAAIGAGNTITLNLTGGTSRTVMACKGPHHVASYRLGTAIHMDGVVTPRPALPDGTWKVKIKIEKCVLGKWVVKAQPHVRGNSTLVNGVKTAVFKFAYKPRVTGIYRARSYYYGYTPYIRSDDVHYKVHR
jgi:hypothetical protein